MSKEIIGLVKLTTGEELIAMVHVDDDQGLSVNFPAVAVHVEDDRFALRPWMFGKEIVDKDAWIALNPISVLCLVTPPDELIESYNALRNKVLSPIIQPTPEETQVLLNE